MSGNSKSTGAAGTRSAGARTGLDRAAMWLGVVALLAAASTVLRGELDFFHVRGWGVVVTAGLGVVALVGGFLALRLLTLVAAAGFLAAAILQLVQLDGYLGNVEAGVLGGTSATVALWLMLAIGLGALALSPPVVVRAEE